MDDVYSLEKLNSGEVVGISSVQEEMVDENKDLLHTVITLSDEVKAKTFVHVLEFLYTGRLLQ